MVQLDRKERVKALLDNVGRSLRERDLPVSAAYQNTVPGKQQGMVY